MVRLKFGTPEEEADFKERQRRDPADALELQTLLVQKKHWLDTCDKCFESDKNGLDAISFHGNARYDNYAQRSPMTILLPELLIHIFLFLKNEEPPRVRETWNHSFSDVIVTPHLGWILVTQVCRRWRYIAVDAAVLWTHFCHGAILGPSWTQEFMVRAKSAPVTIGRFGEYARSVKMLCDYIIDHSPHIHDLTISADWTDYDLVSDIANTFAPMMVTADIDAGFGNYLYPPLFGCYAPNIKRVRLTNIHPWRSSTFLQGLLELDVSMCSSFPPDIDSGDPDPIVVGILPPLHQALDILDEAPNLQRLTLHYAFPPDDIPLADRRQVYLNKIKTLSLSAKIVDCIPFFARVVFPYNADLDLTCIPGLYVELFQDLFYILRDRISQRDDHMSAVSRLEVGTGKFGDKCLLRMYADTLGLIAQNGESRDGVSQRCDISSKPIITLSLAYATSPQHIYVLRTFFATMPLHGLSYLAIYGCWCIDSDGWRTIIRDSHVYLRSVRLLVLGQDCAQYFFHAIHDGETSILELRPPAFPDLDALILRNIDFATFSCALDKVSFQEQMMYDLHGRERRGRKLRVLHFISCQGLDESWIADLREVVRFVVFGF